MLELEWNAASAVPALDYSFRGPVHLPGDEGYDAERATWAGRIDPHPAIVAEAECAADVQAAVLTAREHELRFAVQATGHGTHVPSDDGLLLKTGRMAEVLVDPDHRIARVGPGARWGDVIASAAPFGLAPLSGSSASVGVAGYTLGGGFGWLSRRYGLAADSLRRAEVVSADGRLLTATAERNSDLFWALRAGGPNFAVVTSLELELYPVAQVYGGTALFPLGRAGALLRRYRDIAAHQPEELNVSIVVTPESVGIRGLYAGATGDAIRALRPLVQAGGTPLVDEFRTMGYAETGTIGGTPPRHFDHLERLSDQAIDAIAAAAPNTEAVEVRHWGGAVARTTGPAGHPHLPFAVTVNGETSPVAPYATGATFLNFLHDPARTRDAYTAENYDRLRALKRVFDPDNLFGVTHNIPPARTEQNSVAAA